MQLLAIIVFCAFLVEAAAGFGSMVIAVTVGALFFTVDELLLTLVPVNLVLSIWLAASGASGIKWKFLLKQVAPLMGLGLLIGTLLASKASDAWWLKPLFGLFTIFAASLSLGERVGVRERPLPAAARSLVLLGAGTIHGIFATGGPLAVFVTAKELPDKHEFRATLSMLWVAMNAALLTTWAVAGKLTADSLTKSAWMLLPLAAGIAAGEWIHRRLDEKKFRLVVAVLLLIAGAVLTIQSLLRGNA